jgi:hypothetical protein
MTFASEASKIVTNKYFLYFIVFLAASNVLGYIVTNKINAVIFFVLVAFLISNFSKNMTIILLVAIIATNLLMANKSMREGMENSSMNMDTETDKSLTEEQKAKAKENAKAKSEMVDTETVDTEKLTDVDRKLGKGLSTLKESDNSEEAKAKLDAKKSMASEENTEGEFDDMESKDIVDPSNRDLNKRKKEPETFKANSSSKKNVNGFHNKKGNSSLSNAAPVNGSSRIDYATTLENAYTDLDNILGSDKIGKLTNDTQKLMGQQQKLFDTMNNMIPMIETAKGMMDQLDMGQLNGLANMAKGLK